MATKKSDAKTRRAPDSEGIREAALRAKFIKSSISFRDSLRSMHVPSRGLCLLPLRFVQLLSDLVFFVANVFQMALEQW